MSILLIEPLSLGLERGELLGRLNIWSEGKIPVLLSLIYLKKSLKHSPYMKISTVPVETWRIELKSSNYVYLLIVPVLMNLCPTS